jgi:peroxiredoxin
MVLARIVLVTGLMLPLVAPAAAHAPSAPQPLPTIVRKYMAAMLQARTLSVEAVQTARVGPILWKPPGQPDRPPDVVSLSLVKPNRLLLTTGEDTSALTVVSDGRALHSWGKDYYTVQEAPGTLEGILARAGLGPRNSVAATLTLAVWTRPDALASLPNLRDAGQEDIGGERSRKVVTFASDAPPGSPVTAENSADRAAFWFDSDTGLPVQAEVTRAGSTYTVRFAHGILDKPIPDIAFAAVPPAGLTWMHTSPLRLETGSPAPDFTLRMLDDTPVTLSASKGRVVLLVFCAPWLPEEIIAPAISLIQKAQNAPSGKDLTVLWVSETDKRDRVTAFVKAHAATPMTMLLDPAAPPQSVGQKLYRVHALPTFYVISRTAQVSACFSGVRLDKRESLQVEDQEAAVSALTHGLVSGSGTPYLADTMDEADLTAALRDAGLTEDGTLKR